MSSANMSEPRFLLKDLPPHPIVAMVEYKERLFVATERQVFEFIGGIFKPLIFAVPELESEAKSSESTMVMERAKPVERTTDA